MRKRSDIFLLVVAVMDAINTAVQWFAQISSFGWSRETWLGIGVMVFFVVVITFMVKVYWAETKKKQETALPNKGEIVPSQISITDEQKELLAFYERQKENWKSSLRLRIVHVTPTIEGDVPKVTFQMEMANYLPIEIKLVKVIHSSGIINASSLGTCELPALPETIEERIPACSERDFPLRMEVGKTNAPNFLRSKLMEPGRVLQWTLTGEWYVEIDGETKLWQYKGAEIRYNQVVERQQ